MAYSKPTIIATDIYKYIARNSDLTIDQAKECFETYAQMLYGLIGSENFDVENNIVLPCLGVFKLRLSGIWRRKGQKYKLWGKEYIGDGRRPYFLTFKPNTDTRDFIRKNRFIIDEETK